MTAADDQQDARWPAPSQPLRARIALGLELERARFFLWAPVLLGVGIAAYFALPREPALLVAFAPLAVMLVLRVVTARGSLASSVVTGLMLVAAGLALAKVRVESVRAPVIEKQLRNAAITGTVVRAEARAPRGQRLTVKVETLAALPDAQRPAFVRVRTMASGGVKAGDRVRLTATLAPPAKPALPGGFDFARSAWFARLGAVGYSYQAAVVLPPELGAATLLARTRFALEDIRRAIAQRVAAVLPGQTGAIATALMSGERGAITAETNSAFKDSGLFHILSISGLHMVVMAGAVFYAVRLLLALVPYFALTWPIKKIAAVAGIAGALGYLAISGAEFATVRAAVMIVIIFGAVLLDRPALALRNVALAALLILVAYPESLLDAGFQMSFAAVTGLIAAYEEVRRRFQRRSEPHPVLRVAMFFGGIVSSTLIASVAVAPFAAYHFHQSQQYAVIANLMAIPVCNFVVMPAALAALVLMPFGLEALALWPMGKGIEAMMWCANLVAKLPGAVGHIPEIPWQAFAALLVGGLWLALWQTRLRLLGGLALISGLVLAPWLPRPDVLIARNGALVAVRDGAGRLSALPAAQSTFELSRWLEHDGDGRGLAAARAASAFRCDAVGCIARVKGALIAVARHPAALVDDCAHADVLVLTSPRPRGCDGPAKVIDVFDVWRAGTHALYIAPTDNGQGPPQIRVETVAAHRGERPWGLSPPHYEPRITGPRRSGDAATSTSDGATAGLPKPRVTPGPETGPTSEQALGGKSDAEASDHAPGADAQRPRSADAATPTPALPPSAPRPDVEDDDPDGLADHDETSPQ